MHKWRGGPFGPPFTVSTSQTRCHPGTAPCFHVRANDLRPGSSPPIERTVHPSAYFTAKPPQRTYPLMTVCILIIGKICLIPSGDRDATAI